MRTRRIQNQVRTKPPEIKASICTVTTLSPMLQILLPEH